MTIKFEVGVMKRGGIFAKDEKGFTTLVFSRTMETGQSGPIGLFTIQVAGDKLGEDFNEGSIMEVEIKPKYPRRS